MLPPPCEMDLLTMVDESLELTHEVEREVREFFGTAGHRSVSRMIMDVSNGKAKW